MKNKRYFVYGTVTKIEPETESSYVTFNVIQSSKKYLKELKNIGIAIANYEVELKQKVLMVFDSKTNDVLNFFTIE